MDSRFSMAQGGTLVGLVGSYNRPSRSRALVEAAAAMAARRYGLATRIIDILDFGPSLGQAFRQEELAPEARALLDEIAAAGVLVVGTPTHKGSYTGLFKHVIDLLDPLALVGKPVLITATGGGDRHALMVEHQLRPLFGFFMAHAMPTAVFASDRSFLDYRLTDEATRQRLEQAVGELAPLVGHAAAMARAVTR